MDLVLEWDGKLYPIEVKCKTTIDRNDTRGLRAFRDTYRGREIMPALIIYAGPECYRVDEHTIALPWNAIRYHPASRGSGMKKPDAGRRTVAACSTLKLRQPPNLSN